MNKNIKRIGVFDSGLGGLSILKQLQGIDSLEYLYVADTAHLPYGDKPTYLIEQYCFDICNYLIYEQHVDLIIIACHTVSSVALSFLQQKFPSIPFIGMVDLVCASAARKTKGKIGILATTATINSHKHKEAILSYNSNINAVEQACPQLVPLLEAFPRNEKALEVTLQYYLEKCVSHEVDTIVLGCTHYSMLSDAIKKQYPWPVELISAESEIVSFLEQNYSLISDPLSNNLFYFVTGDPQEFDRKAYQYMQLGAQSKKLSFKSNSSFL